tara:strand:- start:117 stop:293 length:177 start_codon:yes stop_codon:yes gene_type:complete
LYTKKDEEQKLVDAVNIRRGGIIREVSFEFVNEDEKETNKDEQVKESRTIHVSHPIRS